MPDFNKMTDTVMKRFFEKIQPKVVNYRNHKYFEKDRLRIDLLSELGQINIEENKNGLSNFLDACKRILDICASRKQKNARGNHMSHMHKALSKEIMP